MVLLKTIYEGKKETKHKVRFWADVLRKKNVYANACDVRELACAGNVYFKCLFQMFIPKQICYNKR